jgi:hypothetical protein
MGVVRVAVVFCFFASVVNAQESERIPLPSAMGVLGDSISEALLSEFSLERPPTFGQMLGMVNAAIRFSGLDRLNVFRKKYAKHQHSWATGDDESDIVLSHLERLRSLKSGIKGYNFAVSGAVTADLMGQVDDLLFTERTENVILDYLTVLLGANDLSSDSLEGMVSPLAYERNIERSLRRVLKANPHRAVLLVGLPHIHKVFEDSQKLTAYKVLGKKLSCSKMRELIYGRMIMFNPKSPNYDATKITLEMYRNALVQVARHLAEEFPAAHIRAIHDYDAPSLAKKTLSLDCFHPSLWGQALLAEVTWAYGFWPELVDVNDLLGE